MSVFLVIAAQDSELKEMRRRVRDLEEILNAHFPSSLVQVTGEGKEVTVLGQETTIQLSISSQNTVSLPFPIEQLSFQVTNSKSQRVFLYHATSPMCTLNQGCVLSHLLPSYLVLTS